jgi:ATP-binding cassette, subfamily B, bacterial
MSAVMLWLDAWLTLAALTIIPPLFFVTRRSFDRIADDTRNARAAEGALYDQVQETLSQRLAISAFALERRQLERFRVAGRHTFAQVVHGARADLVLAGGTVLIFVLGAQRVLTHQIGLGDLVLFVSYLTMLYQPLNQLSLGVGRIANAQAALARVEAVISDAAPLRDGAVNLNSRDLRGHVKLENVNFGYEHDRPVLARLSLEIQPGEKVAIVGGSGAGKSTLLALLLRLDDPDAGRIMLDGVDLRDVRIASLRRCVAVVPQPPALFAGTIRVNLGDDEGRTSETDMREAMEWASFGPTFARLPNGFDQEIGERGQQLSEGERQRLALARALLRKAPMLLLDEPTSALDAANEGHIIATLRQSLAQHTMILLSHVIDLTALTDLAELVARVQTATGSTESSLSR